MLIYHRFQEAYCVLLICACHILVSKYCQVPVLLMNSAKYNNVMLGAGTFMNKAKC